MMWVFAVLFFSIPAVLAFVNYKLNKEFKIETSWLALGLAPVVIWLLSTQQLSEFSGFGLDFKLREATAKPVSVKLEGDLIEPEQISADEKEGLSKIRSFVQRQVSAVTLKTDRRGYYNNDAVQRYLVELTRYPFFKYVLFATQEGEFVGLVGGIRLLHEMQNNGLDVVSLLEAGDVSKVPGITQVSIAAGNSKRVALQLMDRNGLSELPVVNEQGKFIGVVERDKITSSIVAQLVSQSAD